MNAALSSAFGTSVAVAPRQQLASAATKSECKGLRQAAPIIKRPVKFTSTSASFSMAEGASQRRLNAVANHDLVTPVVSLALYFIVSETCFFSASSNWIGYDFLLSSNRY